MHRVEGRGLVALEREKYGLASKKSKENSRKKYYLLLPSLPATTVVIQNKPGRKK